MHFSSLSRRRNIRFKCSRNKGIMLIKNIKSEYLLFRSRFNLQKQDTCDALCTRVSGRVTPGRNVYAEYRGQRPGSCPGGRPWPRPGGPRGWARLRADPGRGAGAEKKRGEATWETRGERGVRWGQGARLKVCLPALSCSDLSEPDADENSWSSFWTRKKKKIIMFFMDWQIVVNSVVHMHDYVSLGLMSSHQFQLNISALHVLLRTWTIQVMILWHSLIIY